MDPLHLEKHVKGDQLISYPSSDHRFNRVYEMARISVNTPGLLRELYIVEVTEGEQVQYFVILPANEIENLQRIRAVVRRDPPTVNLPAVHMDEQFMARITAKIEQIIGPSGHGR